MTAAVHPVPLDDAGAAGELRPSALHPSDAARVAAVGLRTRKLRAALSALGIMIGIAAMVGVLGLSESSKSDLLAQLDRLGTNLLTVEAGEGIGRGSGALPTEAVEMIGRIGPVESTSSVTALDLSVYKQDYVDDGQTGGVTVQAVDPDLLDTLGGSVAEGRFHDDVTSAYPTVVLGSVAAERLAVDSASGDEMVLIGGEWFTVIGILDPFELSPDLDRAALIGAGATETVFGTDVVPTTIHVRTDPTRVDGVMAVLGATANPEAPEEVQVSRPSDALEAKEAADDAFTALFLGLGAVALLVGGVGIANVMVISVLERRSEIGLRRALGATKRHVAQQFLGEALLLSTIGGVGGVALGAAVTAIYASTRGWSTLVPMVAVVGGLCSAIVIGVVAGLYPAIRAARMAPTEALRTA